MLGTCYAAHSIYGGTGNKDSRILHLCVICRWKSLLYSVHDIYYGTSQSGS